MQNKLELIWNEANGSGYYPVDEDTTVYDADYFKKYEGYAVTPMGKRLTQERVDFVNTFVGKDGLVLDIGIGSGAFIEARPETHGFDINPVGIAWLRERHKFMNPYRGIPGGFRGVTCFDSLEHIKDISGFLYLIPRGVHLIVSLPIFRDKEHVLVSKHFRKDEHFHYFTNKGFVEFMKIQGFNLCWLSDMEIKLGREDIYTYSFIKA